MNTSTCRQYQEEVKTVAKAFIKPHHSVNILSSNCSEWHISAVAAIAAGWLAAGVYTTNGIEATGHLASTSRANIMVVDTQIQLDKVETIRGELPDLRMVVQIGQFPRIENSRSLMSVNSKQKNMNGI